MANTVTELDLGIGQPGALGAQDDRHHARLGVVQVAPGQAGRFADVAGGRAQVAHPRGQGEGQGDRGQRFFQRVVDGGALQHVERPAGQRHGLRLGGHVGKTGGDQDQFAKAHGLDRAGRRTHVARVAGLGHDEPNA